MRPIISKLRDAPRSPAAIGASPAAAAADLPLSTIVDGTDADDTLNGTAGDDELNGFDGDDILNGLDGEDVLRGGRGADALNGGAGSDTADYGGNFGAIWVDLFSGQALWNFAHQDTLTGIENVIATEFDDDVFGSEGPNRLVGNGGNDRLVGNGGADQLSGGDGDDALEGRAGTDVLQGGDGDDLLTGGRDMDAIDGGAGNDTASYRDDFGAVWVDLSTDQGRWNSAQGEVLVGIENVIGTLLGDRLYGDSGVNALSGQGGDDFVHGGHGADQLDGGVGIDTADYGGNFGAVWLDLATGTGRWNYAEGDILLGIENATGTEYGDRLDGNEAGNRFIGNGGADVIRGLGGDDVVSGGAGADVLDGGAGRGDVLSYAGDPGAVWIDLETAQAHLNSAEGDVIAGFENVTGTAFDDQLSGDYENNRLEGGSGDDILLGRAGNDVLIGGLGADTLDGGLNVDTADYSGAYGSIWIDMMTGQGRWNHAEGDTLTGIDKVIGTAWDDLLESGNVTDYFTGGAGNDTFMFRPGFYKDVITDFDGNGAATGDTIRFRTGIFADFSDMLAHASQQGADVVIRYNSANFLTLQNTQLAELHSSDFIFG